MKRFLLDSNAVTAFTNRREPLADRLRDARARGARMGNCEPVVAELFYGLEFSVSREENTIRLRRGLRQITYWPFGRAAAEAYARLAAELRCRGRPMQVIDMMLATVAVMLTDCTIVSTDSDLFAVQNLSVENWEADSSTLG